MASGVDRGNNGEEETATVDENMDEPGGEETRTNEDQLRALFAEIWGVWSTKLWPQVDLRTQQKFRQPFWLCSMQWTKALDWTLSWWEQSTIASLQKVKKPWRWGYSSSVPWLCEWFPEFVVLRVSSQFLVDGHSENVRVTVCCWWDAG